MMFACVAATSTFFNGRRVVVIKYSEKNALTNLTSPRSQIAFARERRTMEEGTTAQVLKNYNEYSCCTASLLICNLGAP
jgi:hypothetical protein